MDDSSIFLCFGVIVLIINVLLLKWAYDDAEKRGQSGCLVAALVFFAGIPGIIIWLLIRGSLKANRPEPVQYTPNIYAHKRPCPSCGEYISEEASTCRFCGNAVKPFVQMDSAPEKQVCSHCGTICQAQATRCPNCDAPLPVN